MKIPALTNRQEFIAVSRSSLREASDLFVIQARVGDKIPPCKVRLGIIASKKSIGIAVERNRAKRRLRAVMYNLFSRYQPESSFDLVLVARRRLNTAPFSSLVCKAEEALLRFKLLSFKASSSVYDLS